MLDLYVLSFKKKFIWHIKVKFFGLSKYFEKLNLSLHKKLLCLLILTFIQKYVLFV